MPRYLCDDCEWTGIQEDCKKVYLPDGVISNPGGVEPVFLCPKCDSENLIELGEDGAELSTPIIPVPSLAFALTPA